MNQSGIHNTSTLSRVAMGKSDSGIALSADDSKHGESQSQNSPSGVTSRNSVRRHHSVDDSSEISSRMSIRGGLRRDRSWYSKRVRRRLGLVDRSYHLHVCIKHSFGQHQHCRKQRNHAPIIAFARLLQLRSLAQQRTV